MTYKSAADWSDNNVSKDEFDSFIDWYEFVKAEYFQYVDFNINGKEEEFRDLMKEHWLREMGELDFNANESDVLPESATENIPSEIIEINQARQELYADQQRQADSTIRELEAIQQAQQIEQLRQQQKAQQEQEFQQQMAEQFKQRQQSRRRISQDC